MIAYMHICNISIYTHDKNAYTEAAQRHIYTFVCVQIHMHTHTHTHLHLQHRWQCVHVCTGLRIRLQGFRLGGRCMSGQNRAPVGFSRS